MIHLKTFNRKELEELISSGEFKRYDFLPITEHRTKSHIKNPKANDEQTLLILAFYDQKLAGYVGCLPDYFKINGEIFEYGWLSTLYVSNEFRGKKIAQKLLKKVSEEYNGNVAITEFTEEAEALYNMMGTFEYVTPKTGKRYYFRTDLETAIPLKKPEIKSFKPVFTFSDWAINTGISLKNSFVKKPDFKFEILDKIDAESSQFISEFPCNRNMDEINWAIENPWVLEGKPKEENYLFSSSATVFRYFWIKIYDENNQIITCSLLLLRDGHLKTSYLFAKADLNKFVAFLSYFVVKNKVKFLTTYQKQLIDTIEKSKGFPYIYQRDFERKYLFHDTLIQNLPPHFDPDFQDGDGDCFLT